MASKTVKSFLTAPNMKMPIVGIGTFQASDAEVETAVEAALEVGYRHIDTAFSYENEAAIGKVLKRWFDSGKLKREDVFVVTKLPNIAMKANLVADTLAQSLSSLQLSYVDLYLVHHPVGMASGLGLRPRDEEGNFIYDMTTDLVSVWKAMEAQVDAGRAKTIGVSNFNIPQLDRIMKIARIKPVNIQVELHLYFQQKPLQAWCKNNGVTLCAFSPLGSPGLLDALKNLVYNAEGYKELNPMTDPVVLDIAKTHHKTAAQVMLRHLIQLGIAVIPKSIHPDRVKQNIQVFDFELTDAEMSKLNALDKGEEARRINRSLFKGIEKHPENPYP